MKGGLLVTVAVAEEGVMAPQAAGDEEEEGVMAPQAVGDEEEEEEEAVGVAQDHTSGVLARCPNKWYIGKTFNLGILQRGNEFDLAWQTKPWYRHTFNQDPKSTSGRDLNGGSRNIKPTEDGRPQPKVWWKQSSKPPFNQASKLSKNIHNCL